MQQISIIGTVGKCEKATFNGNDYLSISVACNKKKKDGTKETTWYDVSSNSVALLPYIEKGKTIFIQGFPQLNVFARKDGTPGGSIRIFANTIELMGGGNKEQQEQNNQPAQHPIKREPLPPIQSVKNNNNQEDDLPF